MTFEPDGYINGKPFKAHDLKREQFPFLVRYLKEEGYGLGQGPMVAWTVVSEPGVMEVPGLVVEHGPVSVQTMHNDGTAVLTTSEGKNYVADITPEQVQSIHQIAEAVAAGRVKNGHMPPWEEKTDG